MSAGGPGAAGGRFDVDAAVERAGPHAWRGHVHPAWGGSNPNGGYLLALVADALRQASPHPDPLSVTAHYLRPGLAGRPCEVDVRMLREGGRTCTARATLAQDGEARLEAIAALGTLGDPAAEAGPVLAPEPPPLPPPGACVPRDATAPAHLQPIREVLDVLVPPERVEPCAAGRAEVVGWIRFRDGREPDPRALLLFADTFPSALFGLLGRVGWVPTVELTVHLRRRPAPGWIRGRFVAEDIGGGRFVEDGMLWDSAGRLVARSRQLALLRAGRAADGAARRA